VADDLGLEDSLVASIELRDLGDALTDVAEASLDQMLDDGLLCDIPVFGTLARLHKTLGVVRDYIFTRKVVRFLARLGQVSFEERRAFLGRLGTREERHRLGETLVLLLDRLDDMEKPEILARLFAGYVKNRYDWPTFRSLSLALDRMSLPTLPSLRHFYETDRTGFTIGGDDLAQLAAAGLVGFRFLPSDAMTGGTFTKTQLGTLFLEVLDAA
jgi:hypothetical protein